MTQSSSEHSISSQIRAQLAAHQHKKYYTDLHLAKDHILRGFAVHSGVLRPEAMTSIHFAKWLYCNSDLYTGRNVMDMGCGSGILGIVMGLNSAKRVLFVDISSKAIANTKTNIKHYNLGNKSVVLQSDLFNDAQRERD